MRRNRFFEKEFLEVAVIYFSRAGENYSVGNVKKGNTEILAEIIAKETGSNLFKIEPEKPYSEKYDECVNLAKKEQLDKARPTYKGDIADLSKYETIYLGYPNWWGDMPMIVYHFWKATIFRAKKSTRSAHMKAADYRAPCKIFKKPVPKQKWKKDWKCTVPQRKTTRKQQRKKSANGWAKSSLPFHTIFFTASKKRSVLASADLE